MDLVSREDLVADLRLRFAEGGYAGIAPMIDTMLSTGQVHEPAFLTCADCDAQIERTNNPSRQVIRCATCKHEHLLQVNRKWKRKHG